MGRDAISEEVGWHLIDMAVDVIRRKMVPDTNPGLSN